MNPSNKEPNMSYPLESKPYPKIYTAPLGGSVQRIYIQHPQTTLSKKSRKV